MEATSMQFAAAARVLADAARRARLHAPSFRSPPRTRADRTIRGAGTPGATVAVRVKGRPWLAALADMVEGVVVTNRLQGAEADRCRTALWEAVERAGAAALSDAVELRRPPPARPQRRATTVDRAPGWRNRQTQAA